ncbi:hypothetical protein Tco_1421586 [Tanacetum coccineum]
MASSHQQSLVDTGSETHPPLLEKECYLKEIEDDGSTTRKPKHRWETEDDLSGEDLKQYDADIEEMNLILLAIPNDIYNYIDAG